MFRSLAQIQGLISGDAATASPVMGTHELFGTPGKVTPNPLLFGEIFKPEECKLTPETIFTVVIDPAATRRTIAKAHVDHPEDLINCLASL